MTWFQFKQWWHYRRQALSRHGVHSPFVYDFIDNGLRRKTGSIESRVRNYFQHSTIVTVEDPAAANRALQQASEDTILLIKNTHSTPEAAAAWQALCNNPNVTMSIDLYNIGLLLFRKEFKVKQHFVLKRYGQ